MDEKALTLDEALALVTRATEELRVLLQLTPALQHVGAAGRAVKAAVEAAARQAQHQQEREGAIAHLAAEETALRSSVDNFTRKLGALKTEFTAREAPKLEALAALDRQIAEKQQQLAALKAEFEAFRSRLTG